MFEFLHIMPESHFEVLLTLMVVVWGAGRIFKWLRLPPMLGELLAGVLIGPQVLGVLETQEFIAVLAELGVFFLIFHAGLDTDIRELLGRVKISTGLALGGMIPLLFLVFALVCLLGYSALTASFVAVMMAFPSVPIMISVLKNYKLQKTEVGHAALAAAIIAELILFAMLSVVLVLAQSDGITWFQLLLVVSKVSFFFGSVLLLGRLLLPIISPYILNRSGSKGFTFALIVALLFGILAEAIGLHVILGAYLAGMFVREEIEDDKLMRKIEDRFYALSHSFLGPIFFAWVGMTINLAALADYFPIVLSLVLVIIGGQTVGSFLATCWVKGTSIGDRYLSSIVLTARGSTEIAVAQIGFSVLVLATGEKLLPEPLFVSVIAATFCLMVLMPLWLRLELRFFPGNHVRVSTQQKIDL